MSLALDLLKEHLQSTDLTQADFASACGMTAANISDILKGDVSISARNLEKLMRGIEPRSAKLNLLRAYLRDEIPRDYADDVEITTALPSTKTPEHLPAQEALEASLLAAFRELSAKKHQRLAINLVRQIRADDELRGLLTKMLAYVEGEKERATDRLNKPLSRKKEE